MSFHNKSVSAHQFAVNPAEHIPRSTFDRSSVHKTTFDAGLLIPFFCDEVLPGDMFVGHISLYARIATLLYPIFDNVHLETFFFFVPDRILWDNFQKFMGENVNVAGIDPNFNNYILPTATFSLSSEQKTDGFLQYFGIPVFNPAAGTTDAISFNALPFRAYNKIYQDWFRDERFIATPTSEIAGAVLTDDGPDAKGVYVIQPRGKRFDYFTSANPYQQKGNPVSITLANSGVAPVWGNPNVALTLQAGYGAGATNQGVMTLGTQQLTPNNQLGGVASGSPWNFTPGYTTTGLQQWSQPASNSVAVGMLSLSQAQLQGGGTPNQAPAIAYIDTSAAVTVSALRTAIQMQKFLEKNARGGTRYIEILANHFGTHPPDFRLQRSEYIGGGHSMLNTITVAQTAPPPQGQTSPQATLSAFGTIADKGHAFRYQSTEHGFILGLLCVRADLTYQQGVHRMFTRQTFYDHYLPIFANLSEDIIRNDEIYWQNLGANDTLAFGYKPRWDEYRYGKSIITGQFNSKAPTPLDAWHLAQRFDALPTLSASFINENVPLDRALAVTTGPQFLADILVSLRCTRPMPVFSIPGLGGSL